jgi:hypothetical protein
MYVEYGNRGLSPDRLIATHNPAGLIISTSMKVYGEKTGSSEIGGRAKQTAKEIADVLKQRFQEQGWIQSGAVKSPSPY